MKADFAALFDPKGIIVAGASTHPGKFGFVALHNILSCGYRGRVAATNLEATPVLGIDSVRSVDELPDGPWDLVYPDTKRVDAWTKEFNDLASRGQLPALSERSPN